jgi:transcriptional regulator with XRE-family HTH domain
MVNRKLKSAIYGEYPSQVAFAADLQVSDSLLSKIVRGWREPTPELRRAMAEKLGVPERELFPA